MGFPGFGSMKGIDPYIKTLGACHSSNRFHVESILSLSENIIT